MNNQRRHELERNVLADKLGTGIEKIHPLVKPIAIVAVLGLVGLFGYQIVSSQNSKKASKEWTEYYFNRTSGDAQSFEALGQAFSSSVTGQWAKHSAARGFLSDGIDSLYSNRKEAIENIGKAITQWESVKDSSVPELRAAATQGLALAHESLGELDDAIRYYEVYVALPGISEDQRETINGQISYLKSSGTKGFYDWFNKLDPKPAAPPTISGDLSRPPTSPSISLDPNNLPTFTPTTPADTKAPAGIELTPPTTAAPANEPTATAPANPPVGAPDPAIEPASQVPAAPEPAAPTTPAPTTPTPAAEPTVPGTPPTTEPSPAPAVDLPGTPEPGAPSSEPVK